MEPGKDQEKDSAARCPTFPAAPSPQSQALRDSLEHPPMPLTIPYTQGHVGTCPAASHPRGAGGRAGEGRAHWEPPEIPSTFALKH